MLVSDLKFLFYHNKTFAFYLVRFFDTKEFGEKEKVPFNEMKK